MLIKTKTLTGHCTVCIFLCNYLAMVYFALFIDSRPTHFVQYFFRIQNYILIIFQTILECFKLIFNENLKKFHIQRAPCWKLEVEGAILVQSRAQLKLICIPSLYNLLHHKWISIFIYWLKLKLTIVLVAKVLVIQ